MIAQAILTVSESKRLIAKGVAALPAVRRAMQKGIIAIGRGTTNGYVVEEILGRRIEKHRMIAGTTTPVKGEKPTALSEPKIPGCVIRDGEPVEGLSVDEAAREMMGPGDVFIKGANALDYRNKVAGILILHPKGGTIGSVIGHIIARRIELVIPVGLEKLVYEDIHKLSRMARQPEILGRVPTLFPVSGTIITEIEALELLCGVKATLYAAGGIAGAEGGVRLLLEGTKEELDCAIRLIESVQGEPPFVE
jgi:hypothetical protein